MKYEVFESHREDKWCPSCDKYVDLILYGTSGVGECQECGCTKPSAFVHEITSGCSQKMYNYNPQVKRKINGIKNKTQEQHKLRANNRTL